jgi:hypothetical protein
VPTQEVNPDPIFVSPKRHTDSKKKETLYTKESWVFQREDLIVRYVTREKRETIDTTNVMNDKRKRTGYPKSVNATKPVWVSNLRKDTKETRDTPCSSSL